MEAKDFDLEAVPVRVTNVNFDGLQRTKDDFVAEAVRDVFRSKTFGDLILRVGQAQEKLRKLEIFREVGTIVDVDKPGADYKSGDGYHVTFVVKELSRVAASAKTQMGAQADAQVKTGLRMPNLLGRGERLEVEYSYSSNKEKDMEISILKPLLGLANASVKGSIFHSKSSCTQSLYSNTAVGSLVTFHCHKTDSKLRGIHQKLEYEGTWRHITPTRLDAPLAVRFDCGHSFKSAVRHVLTVDGRDGPIFPSTGIYMNLLQELSGLFGDVRYHKFDVDLQHNVSLSSNMVFQTAFRIGIITPFSDSEKNCGIADRFFSGGPYSLRGFHLRGVKSTEISTGHLTHWTSAAHLYTRLPYVNRRYPLVENCRLHFFINAGNLANNILDENLWRNLRASYGMGIAVGLGNFGRLEVNYCWPVKYTKYDACVKGIQVGVGVHFL